VGALALCALLLTALRHPTKLKNFKNFVGRFVGRVRGKKVNLRKKTKMLVRIGSLALALAPAGAFLAPHSRPGVIGAGSPALRHAAPPHRSISSPVHRPRPARGAGAGAAMQAEGIVLAAGVVDAVQAQLSALTLDDIAGGLFAISLFPYLGFLYHLGRPENKTPELGLFGFKFLLAFVAASIPAAIAAKVLYGAQLADVDYLHGGAESFLALTNLFIVLGFRRAVAGSPVQDSQTHFVYCVYTAKYTRALTFDNVNVCQGYKDPPVQEMLSSPVATAGALAGALFLVAQGLPGDMLALAGAHAEPANALSFPTYTSLEKSREPLAPCMPSKKGGS
jgi:hypothetical protein